MDYLDVVTGTKGVPLSVAQKQVIPFQEQSLQLQEQRVSKRQTEKLAEGSQN